MVKFKNLKNNNVKHDSKYLFNLTKIRKIENNSVLMLINGRVRKVYNFYDLLRREGFDGIIRVLNSDFSQINKRLKYLTHFNLYESNHIKRNKYLIVRIIKQGYYKSEDDYQPPILDFSNSLITECIDVEERLKYEDLKLIDFKYSMIHIKSIASLKNQIYLRYSKSLPFLNKKEIENLGVSITKLELKGEFDRNFKYLSYVDFLDFDKSLYKSSREGFGDGIVDAKLENDSIVALTADLKSSLKLNKFEKLFKSDFYEFSISEQNMMSAAAGMCLVNKIPFVTSFAVFNPGRNWDQLRVSVCYSNHNVKIIGSHAGLTTGADGATHQALEDIAITRVLPNLKVVVPADYNQARKATFKIANYKSPFYLRLSREKSVNIFGIEDDFKIGFGQVLDKGKDVSIISCGFTLQLALIARKKLLDYGIFASVINLHTIKPIDKDLILKYAKKTGAIVTVEEHQKYGGLGSAVSEVIVGEYPIPMEIIGIEDVFGESGDFKELFKKYGLTVENIILNVKKVIKRKKLN